MFTLIYFANNSLDLDGTSLKFRKILGRVFLATAKKISLRSLLAPKSEENEGKIKVCMEAAGAINNSLAGLQFFGGKNSRRPICRQEFPPGQKHVLCEGVLSLKIRP